MPNARHLNVDVIASAGSRRRRAATTSRTIVPLGKNFVRRMKREVREGIWARVAVDVEAITARCSALGSRTRC